MERETVFGGGLDLEGVAGRARPIVRDALGVLRAEAVLGRAAEEVLAELESGVRPEFPVTITITNADGVTTGEMIVIWTLKPAR